MMNKQYNNLLLKKKTAIAQINSLTGAIKQNAEHVEEYINLALNKNIEVLIFPKNIILGINAKDLYKNNELIIQQKKIQNLLKSKYEQIEIIFDEQEFTDAKIINNPKRYSYGEFWTFSEYLKRQEGLIININPVGAFDERIYEGRSIASFNGKIVALGKFLEEDLIILNYEEDLKINPLSFEEETFKILSFGIKDYCRKTGFKKIVLGLSGGLDSAITAVLACDAIGANNVLGITMPSKYSTEGSYNDSFKLAKNLGMVCIEKPIKSLYDEFIHSIQEDKTYNDLAEENIQPRIRALILMNYSNRGNRLLLSTGNKSECAMGYCTLYGDTCGGLNPIADVFKTDLYRISNWVNKNSGKEIIPDNILTKAPSAELKPNQKDEDSLPPYAVLDDVLRRYIEDGQSYDDISKDYGTVLVSEIIKKLNFNEFKRHQSTLFFEISKKSLGTDRNYPIVCSKEVI
ncbi:NAD(+) synthase [bacterium]|nr:NAD(+) synthase [bacterium]